MEDYRAAWQCTCPPELSEIALIAAADEEASQEVYQHLAACAACSERMHAIADLQKHLHQHLYRLFCPSSDELAAFLEHQMLPAAHAQLENHLEQCPHCQRELVLLQEITATPLVLPATPFQPRIVAQPQRKRSPPYNEGSVFQAGPLRITLRVEQRGTQLPRLRGAVHGCEPGTTASLICKGRVVSAMPLTKQGCFILEEPALSECSLSLRLPHYEVIVEALRF